MKTILFSLFASIFVFCGVADAGVLQATVTKVDDARTVTVVAAGRSITVELEAIDVPKGDEPFSAIAQKHLSDLIMGKNVTVEYTGIGMAGRFVGKVVLSQIDIGQQMIRDGVARYSKEMDADLSVEERNLYLGAEDAAHREKRGIWQDGVLASPGVWRKPATDTIEPKTTTSSNAPVRSRKVSPTSSFLTSEKSDDGNRQIEWPMFTPPGAPFKARIPVGGSSYQVQVPLPGGQSVQANLYIVSHPRIFYYSEWFDGATNVSGFESNYEEYLSLALDQLHRSGYPCELMSSNDVTNQGYHGRQYRVTGCALHGGIRLFRKYTDHHLKIVLVGAITEDAKHPQADQLLESFTLNP